MMSKKSINILITTLIVVVIGGYFLYRSLPVIVAMAANTIMAVVILVGIPLMIYGLYRLVSFLNK